VKYSWTVWQKQANHACHTERSVPQQSRRVANNSPFSGEITCQRISMQHKFGKPFLVLMNFLIIAVVALSMAGITSTTAPALKGVFFEQNLPVVGGYFALDWLYWGIGLFAGLGASVTYIVFAINDFKFLAMVYAFAAWIIFIACLFGLVIKIEVSPLRTFVEALFRASMFGGFIGIIQGMLKSYELSK
jgi:hypothetical protein